MASRPMGRTHALLRAATTIVACSVFTLGSAVLSDALADAATEPQRPPGDLSIEVFTRIGSPGQPDGLYVTEDRVYVGTHNAGAGDRDVASKLFAFDHDGMLVDEFTIEGQDIAADNGILAIARDADGVLYIADREPARIVALDPATGEQSTYATFRDLPSCATAADGEDCSAGLTDMADFTDAPLFAPDGTMYVTDLQQSVIWRVPKGGGEGEVWLTDDRFESVFGVNGMQLREDGRTMLISVTADTTSTGGVAGLGYLYELVIGEDGEPGELSVFWESGPADGPDGFALAASGRVYVPLAGSNGVAVLSPDGVEVARVPANPIANQLQEVPFDTPVAVAFLGDDILVNNQSFFTGDSDHWAVLRIAAGEPGLPLYEPDLGPARGRPADVGREPRGQGGLAAAANGPARGGLAATGGGSAVLAVALATAGGVLRRRRAA